MLLHCISSSPLDQAGKASKLFATVLWSSSKRNNAKNILLINMLMASFQFRPRRLNDDDDDTARATMSPRGDDDDDGTASKNIKFPLEMVSRRLRSSPLSCVLCYDKHATDSPEDSPELTIEERPHSTSSSSTTSYSSSALKALPASLRPYKFPGL